MDRCGVGQVFRHRALEVGEPGSGLETHLGEPGLPHIDVRLLLERETEACNAVVEVGRAHAKAQLLAQHSAGNVLRRQRLAREARIGAEARALAAAVGRKLVDGQGEVPRIALDHVPAIRRELVLHPVDEAGRAVQPQALMAPQAHAQQPVEAGEMVHVGVRHEHIAEAQDLLRHQPADVTEVEHQRPALVPEIEV